MKIHIGFTLKMIFAVCWIGAAQVSIYCETFRSISSTVSEKARKSFESISKQQKAEAEPEPGQTNTEIQQPESVPHSLETDALQEQVSKNWDIVSLDTARNVEYLSDIEKNIILEMNKVRTDPKKYAELYIVPFLEKFKNDGTYDRDGVTVLTHEGIAAVKECIRVLNSQKPIHVLIPEKGLSLAAQSHTMSQAKTAETGHEGVAGGTPFTRIKKYGTFKFAGENISYGVSDACAIIIQLLVDDGVPDRGHRTTILDPKFTQTGCGYAEGHKKYGSECVITYANGYVDNKK